VVDDPVRTRPHRSALRRRAASWAVTPAPVASLASPRVREHPDRSLRLLQRVDPVHRSPFGVDRPVPRHRPGFTIRGYPTLPVTHDGNGG
jgi:hypothetical protein